MQFYEITPWGTFRKSHPVYSQKSGYVQSIYYGSLSKKKVYYMHSYPTSYTHLGNQYSWDLLFTFQANANNADVLQQVCTDDLQIYLLMSS